MNNKFWKGIIIGLILVLPFWLWAGSKVFGATYYVTEAGAGGNDGTSYADAESLSDFNGGSFGELDDDTVYFCDMIRGTVTIPDSGTSGHVATFRGDYVGHVGVISGTDLSSTYETSILGNLSGSADCEEGDLTDWDTTTSGGTGACVVHADAAQNGSWGTKLSLAAAGDTAYVEHTFVAESEFFAIVHFSINALTMADGDAFWFFRTTAGGVYIEIEIQRSGADYQIRASGGGWTTFTKADWQKLTVHGKAHASTGFEKVWLNDVSILNLTGLSNAANTTAYVRWGPFFAVDAGTSGDVYLDDAYVYIATGATNYYQSTITIKPNIVFFDGTKGSVTASADAVDAANEWYYCDGCLDGADNILYVYSTSDPDTAFTAPGIEAGARDVVIDLNGKNYLVFDGLNLFAMNDIGSDAGIIDDWDNSGVARYGLEIKNSIIQHSNDNGVRINLKNATGSFDNIQIHNNTFNDLVVSQSFGIKLSGDAGSEYTNCDIYRNTFDTNYQSILIEQQTSIEVYENKFVNSQGEADINIHEECSGVYIYRNYSNGGTGEFIWLGGSSIVTVSIYDNVITNFDVHRVIQLDNGGAIATNIYNNTIYGCTSSAFGLGITGQVTGVNIENNIIDNLGGDASNLEFKNASSFTSNHNCWDDSRSFYDHDAATSRNWAYWTGTLNHDANGLYEDPLFTDAAGDDLTLQDESPCINAGTVPSGFEAIFPLDPDKTVVSPWTPVIATSDYDGIREIGAYVFPSLALGGPFSLGLGLGLN